MVVIRPEVKHLLDRLADVPVDHRAAVRDRR